MVQFKAIGPIKLAILACWRAKAWVPWFVIVTRFQALPVQWERIDPNQTYESIPVRTETIHFKTTVLLCKSNPSPPHPTFNSSLESWNQFKTADVFQNSQSNQAFYLSCSKRLTLEPYYPFRPLNFNLWLPGAKPDSDIGLVMPPSPLGVYCRARLPNQSPVSYTSPMLLRSGQKSRAPKHCQNWIRAMIKNSASLKRSCSNSIKPNFLFNFSWT